MYSNTNIINNRHDTKPIISDDEALADRMTRSLGVLKRYLDEGRHVYGVNTGYGGSADTRTDDVTNLQKGLIQHHNAAILLPSDRGEDCIATLQDLRRHSLPNQLVRASILVRCNSLLRGHSAVRLEVVQAMAKLVEQDLSPVIPLRGSISASGDLTPLAYIAGALEGNPDIFVNGGKARQYRIMPADEALALAGIRPFTFGPKEGLGLLNGTGVSTAAASIVIHEAQQLALLSQVLTAMGTEALLGTSHNYHPFIAEIRPHPGQREVAHNVFNWLDDSQLALGNHIQNIGLAQDRYALRTASQWIGPQLEDLLLAQQQVEIELNSTTDNPLIDIAGNAIHHGGNFQAASITSAMEKTMLATQMIGKLLFAQCSEIINPMLNKGLPPNLAIDDPSLSFAFKGVDINMAAYLSELGYLTHPVSPHVQSAEMHNQAVNSLALIAARYAGDAVEVLSMMSATYLYVLCQALDLRVLHLEFVKVARPLIERVTLDAFGAVISPGEHEALNELVWGRLIREWDERSRLDLRDRAVETAASTVDCVLDFITTHTPSLSTVGGQSLLSQRQKWKKLVGESLYTTYDGVRNDFLDKPSTPAYLCAKSRQMYTYVRQTLNVPAQRGLEDHPTYGAQLGRDGQPKKTIGSNISIVYAALRSGGLMEVVLK